MTATGIKARCEGVDQITEWTDADGQLMVEPGDLIVKRGRFEQVARIRLSADGQRVLYTVMGGVVWESAAPDDLVAVRRYIETTEE